MRELWRWIDRLEGGLASVGAGLCLLAMMLITIAGVFGRYVLGSDLIPGGYNIIERIAFPLLVFWALPMAHREGSFPRFELLEARLSPRLRRWIDAVVLTVEIAVFIVVLAYCARFAWDAVASARQMQIGTDLWPAWPVIVMIPLGFALMLAEMVRLLWATVTGGDGAGPPSRESEPERPP